MTEYRLAEKHELHEIATLFTESFLDYPLFRLLLAPGRRYKEQLFKLNYINTKSYYHQDGCFVNVLDGKIVSAVLLKKGDQTSPGFFRYLFNGGAALMLQLGIRRLIHVLKTLEHMKEYCKRYGKKSWYIDSIAVAKGYQGKSLGSAMFRDFLFPHISKHGGGRVTLVTHTELNKKFYGKHGFDIFSEYLIGPRGHQIANYSFQMLVLHPLSH